MIFYRNFIRNDRKIKLSLNGITDIVPCDYIKFYIFPNDVEFDVQNKYENLSEDEFTKLFYQTNRLTYCSMFEYEYLKREYSHWVEDLNREINFDKLYKQTTDNNTYDLDLIPPQLKGYRIFVSIICDGQEDDFGGLVIDLHQLKLLTEYRHDLFNFIYDQTFCDYISQLNNLKSSNFNNFNPVNLPYIEHHYLIEPHKYNITRTYSLMEDDGTIRLESLILACIVNTTKELFNESGDYSSLLDNLNKIEVV